MQCNCRYGVRARPTPPLTFYYCIPFAFVLLHLQFCVYINSRLCFFHNLKMLLYVATSQWLHLCLSKRLKKMTTNFVRCWSQVGLFSVAIGGAGQGWQIYFLPRGQISEIWSQQVLKGPTSVIWGQISEIWPQNGQPGNPGAGVLPTSTVGCLDS